MNRLIIASAALLLLAFVPVGSQAAPAQQRPDTAYNPSVVLVDGWWEQEHHDDAPDRYWKLQPQQRQRYDKLQAEQNRRDAQRRRLDDEDHRAVEQQHGILGFSLTVH